MSYPFGSLPDNLAAFCGLLRREFRFRIGSRELHDAVRALGLTNLGDERAVRNALRPVLSARLEDVQVFDRAFDRFFHGRGAPPLDAGLPGRDLAGPPATPRTTTGQRGTSVESQDPAAAVTFAADTEGEIGASRDLSKADGELAAAVLRASYSPLGAEGEVPDLEPPNRRWREAAAVLASSARARASRRWRPAVHGQRFDFRRTLRSSLHTGGDMVTPRWRGRRRRQPRFVMLVDGSRSMALTARPALQMAVALTAVSPDTETFTFSTALKGVTHDARRAAAGERRPLMLHHAWGGGTTIGACLAEFLRRFGERAVGRETVVIIASDGLDVGDAELLRESMARLARLAAATIWLNPLAATRGYEPTARGMRLARPFVTVFAAANDPAGLIEVARTLRVR